MKIQPTTKIKNLVFQGGGVKGLAYLAVRDALEQLGLNFNQIERVAGTSAGSIIALGLALNMTTPELEKVIATINLPTLLDNRYSAKVTDKVLKAKDNAQSGHTFLAKTQVASVSPKLAYGLTKHHGLFQGDKLRELAEKIIEEKTGKRHLTFQELHELKDDKNHYKDLFIIGTNITTHRAETFSYIDTPNMLISSAMVISSAVPWVFEPQYKHVKKPNGEVVVDKQHRYQDGGINENYPLNIFDNRRNLDPSQSGHFYNDETLGFMFVSSEEMQNLNDQPSVSEAPSHNFKTHNYAIFSTLLNAQTSAHYRNSEDQKRTMYIDKLDINTLDFNLKPEQIQRLVNSTTSSIFNYFNRDKSQMKIYQLVHLKKDNETAEPTNQQLKNSKVFI